jgi:hypothetical protein
MIIAQTIWILNTEETGTILLETLLDAESTTLMLLKA